MSRPRKTAEQREHVEARRAQVLEAAGLCFRRSGFHNASMAEISKAAGMSIGHIYHYFKNKEAIIAALVERDSKELNEVFDNFGTKDDPVRALLDDVASGLSRTANAERAALKLEILAETARNPKLAKLLRASDSQASQRFTEIIGASLKKRQGTGADDLNVKVKVIGALFSGFMQRSVFDDTPHSEATVKAVRRAIAAVLSED